MRQRNYPKRSDGSDISQENPSSISGVSPLLSAADAAFVVIPPNYDHRIVPICIRTIDDEGLPVFPGWIDAVWPIAESLRTLAVKFLGDKWRVSEVTEGSVHTLSRKFGERLGRSPSDQIYANAHWLARDLKAGGLRVRQGKEIELSRQLLASLREPRDFARAFEDQEIIERIEKRLQARGLTEVLDMMRLYLFEGEEAAMLGARRNSQARNTLSQRFYRTLRRALKLR